MAIGINKINTAYKSRGNFRKSPAVNNPSDMTRRITLSYEEACEWIKLKTKINFKAPTGLYESKENAKNCILATLDTMPGFKGARENNDIKTMADLYRKYVKKYKAVDKARYRQDGQLAFLCEKGGLKGLITHPRNYFKKTGSPASVLRLVLPQLIDLRNPDALDPLEVEHSYWTDPENAKYHIFLAFDTIPGFKDARENNDIKTMANLYRKSVIKYKTVDKSKYRQDGQLPFLCEKGGLRGLITNPRKYLKKTNSPVCVLRLVLPQLIDLRNPDALNPLEVEHSYWTDPENAKYHIFLALDAIPGFKGARENNDIKTMADLYRKYVINYKAVNKAKYQCDGQTSFFHERGGLSSLMSNRREYLKKTGSPPSVLRLVIPQLVDDNNPHALHSWEVKNNKINNNTNTKNDQHPISSDK